MSYKIKLDNFEGPFDLLFHLIEKEEWISIIYKYQNCIISGLYKK